MQDTAPSEIVQLDSLNAKQKLKEFKLTSKEMRSKDVAVKMRALEKFSDLRYLTDGGCLVPFINSVLPKKVFILKFLQLTIL